MQRISRFLLLSLLLLSPVTSYAQLCSSVLPTPECRVVEFISTVVGAVLQSQQAEGNSIIHTAKSGTLAYSIRPGVLILSSLPGGGSDQTTVACLPPDTSVEIVESHNLLLTGVVRVFTAGTLILSSDQTTVASLPPGAPVDIRCDRPGAEKSRLLLQTGLVSALYQNVWGQPIAPEALADYTFLLSAGWTLADVRADMEALYLQTVVVPVLIAISGLLQ